jgi:hypothetical protein
VLAGGRTLDRDEDERRLPHAAVVDLGLEQGGGVVEASRSLVGRRGRHVPKVPRPAEREPRLRRSTPVPDLRMLGAWE